MRVKTHVPVPGRSVRPADLTASQREALRRSLMPARRRSRRGELVGLVALALVIAFVIKTVLVQAFFIPSGSMIPTLEVGDRVLVEKVTYRFRDPRRGEVIVFKRPGVEQRGGVGQVVREFFQGIGLVQPDAHIDLIKRVVGLPGDRVLVRAGQVFVNGVPLEEPYARVDQRDYGPIVVPPGEYFVLGDNRGDSDDSRFSLGTVPRDHVVGKAFVILWPPWNFRLGLAEDTRGP